MKKLALLSTCLLIAVVSLANDKSFKQFNDTKVHFSAFNSNFIDPQIASTYNIVRGNDKGLVNIAVVDDGKSGGRTARVTGTVSNIFAQQQVLNFFEVREGDAVYYLAPFEFEHEDAMTFNIQVVTDPAEPAKNIKFQRIFYHDDK